MSSLMKLFLVARGMFITLHQNLSNRQCSNTIWIPLKVKLQILSKIHGFCFSATEKAFVLLNTYLSALLFTLVHTTRLWHVLDGQCKTNVVAYWQVESASFITTLVLAQRLSQNTTQMFQMGNVRSSSIQTGLCTLLYLYHKKHLAGRNFPNEVEIKTESFDKAVNFYDCGIQMTQT